jgi:NADH:ubiquinone oxidoreductase subunit C
MRVSLDEIRDGLGTKRSWKRRADGWRLDDPHLDVLGMARLMSEAQARLVTITAKHSPGERGFILHYHWDLDGQSLTFNTSTNDGRIPSIALILPAAAWIEREVHDYLSIVFVGRDDLSPLVLRADDKPGFFTRPEEKRG